MSDQTGAGQRGIFQFFTVPMNAISINLSLELYIQNHAGAYFTPNTLDAFSSGPNQQARIDLLTAASGDWDLGASVIYNVFASSTTDPVEFGYVPITANLTGVLTPGNTYRLRIAEVDSQLWFNMGVDQISIDTGVPEPSSMILLGTALVGVAVLRRRRA